MFLKIIVILFGYLFFSFPGSLRTFGEYRFALERMREREGEGGGGGVKGQ